MWQLGWQQAYCYCIIFVLLLAIFGENLPVFLDIDEVVYLLFAA